MKRFYNDVSVAEVDGGWQVMLDQRRMKTQIGSPQVVPTRALAELLAAEWTRQGEEIDPKDFFFRDLADYAIDVVGQDRDAAVAALLAYIETDTLCYRADPEEALYARQQQLWEPLVAACEAREGVKLARVCGIVHKPQVEATLAVLRERLSALDDFTLAALQPITSLAASLVVGLAALDPAADPAALFAAGNAEEDWQAELWGWDYDAEETRKTRERAFTLATDFLKAIRG